MDTGGSAAGYGGAAAVIVLRHYVYFNGWITPAVKDLSCMDVGNVAHDDWSICLIIWSVYSIICQLAEDFLQASVFALQRNNVPIVPQSHLHQLFLNFIRRRGLQFPVTVGHLADGTDVGKLFQHDGPGCFAESDTDRIGPRVKCPQPADRAVGDQF